MLYTLYVDKSKQQQVLLSLFSFILNKYVIKSLKIQNNYS